MTDSYSRSSLNRDQANGRKQAKILSGQQIDELLAFATHHTCNAARNRIIVLLSAKAGLRADEIANLTWGMVIDPTGDIGAVIDLANHTAKNGSGRRIPIRRDLREALLDWRDRSGGDGPVVVSDRGGPMRPTSIVNRAIDLTGCSSHSGRVHLSHGQRGWCTRPVGRCAMYSCWPGTDRSKPPSATLTATPTPGASSYSSPNGRSRLWYSFKNRLAARRSTSWYRKARHSAAARNLRR